MEINNKMPPNIKPRPSENIPKPYRDIASGMERQFLEYMLERMKSTISEEELSTAQNYYDSLQTSEQAKAIAEKDGGMGIQEMILNQIYPKSKRQAITQYNIAKENKL